MPAELSRNGPSAAEIVIFLDKTTANRDCAPDAAGASQRKLANGSQQSHLILEGQPGGLCDAVECGPVGDVTDGLHDISRTG